MSVKDRRKGGVCRLTVGLAGTFKPSITDVVSHGYVLKENTKKTKKDIASILRVTNVGRLGEKRLMANYN